MIWLGEQMSPRDRELGASIVIAPRDAPLLGVVREYLSKHFEYHVVTAVDEAIRLLSRHNGKESFVLAYSEVCKDLELVKLRACCDALKIAYWAERESPWTALRLCGRSLADDYWYRPSYTEERLQVRLAEVIAGAQPLYPGFVLPCRRNCRIFVVTPFNTYAMLDYQEGIMPALKALGRRNTDYAKGDDWLQSDFILTKIRSMLEDCGLVIANISPYSGVDNPNVYLEAGYALGKGAPFLLIRRQAAARIPVNIQGIEYCQYRDCSELALRLYFGLRQYFDC